MPYVKSERRTLPVLYTPIDSGELNYLFTRICLDYLALKGEKYQYYADIVGALESCKLEFYRRAVAPYEDKKIIENGDVY